MRRVRRVSPLRNQHRVGDFEAYAEALQPCREGPAQVMQPPAAPGTPGPPPPG